MPGYFTKEYNQFKMFNIRQYKIISLTMVGPWKEVFFLFSSHPFSTQTNQINDKPGLFC